jgi:hypothetical protein
MTGDDQAMSAEVAQRWIERPMVALPLSAMLGALALHVGADMWMIQSQPTSARPFGVSIEVAKAVFVGGCLAVVLAARWTPRARDAVHLLLGIAWFTAVCGWRFSIGMALISVAVYALADRVHPHLAMLLTALLLLAGAYRWLGTQPSQHGAIRFTAFAAARLVYYAFEVRAIPRRRRSLLRFLIYTPFSLLLWPGPTMLSYQTYTSERPRPVLTAMACRQVLGGSAKLLGCALLLRLALAQLPSVASFASLSFGVQACWVLLAYPLLFFSLSIRQDLAASLCNFAGYYAPDAFARPFLAVTPFEVWRRWNVHQVGFLRLAFIYEAARRHRSLIVIAAAGMFGSGVYHVFYRSFTAGPEMAWQAALATMGSYFAVGVPLLLVFLPIEKRRRQLSAPARVVSTLITQLVIAVMTFAAVDIGSFVGQLPAAPFDLLLGMFGHRR